MKTSMAIVALLMLLATGAAASSRHLLDRPRGPRPPPPPACPAIPADQTAALNVRSWDDCEAPKSSSSPPCKGSCVRGYAGKVMAHCDKSADGLTASWRFTGNCSLIVCSDPLPAVANATWATGCAITPGSTCTATCGDLFVQTGPINSTCVLSGGGGDHQDGSDHHDRRRLLDGQGHGNDGKGPRAGVWSTPTANCTPATITQAVVSVPATLSGGCTAEATAAVVATMNASLAAQGATGQQISGFCRELTAAAPVAGRHLLETTPVSVEFIIIVVYTGPTTAVQTVVTAINTNQTAVIDLAASLQTATQGQVTISTAAAETKNTTVSTTPQDATLSLVRSGPASIPVGGAFFLTAVYTGTNGLAAAGVTLTGPIVSPADSVACTPVDTAPVTNAVGMAVWSCTAGQNATTATLSVSGPNPNTGVDVVASLSVPVVVNCIGAFGAPSACSVACGAGTATQTYSISVPASVTPPGQACPYADGFQQLVSCTGATTCGECEQCTAGSCAALTNGTTCSVGKCYNSVCTTPVDCVGAFGNWTDCSSACGAGQQTRTFTITTAANVFGQACTNAAGDTQTQACTGPITCSECSACNGTACVLLTAGELCSNNGSCYDGVCQAGVAVNTITALTVPPPTVTTSALYLAWYTSAVNDSMLLNTNYPDAFPTIETLAAGTLSLSGITANVTDAITTSPPGGITSALRVVSPTSSVKPEFGTAFLNATPSQPAGLFNGMKFKSFLQDAAGSFTFSWYRAAVAGAGDTAPVFRFTVVNPAWALTSPYYSAFQKLIGRVEFVWLPGNNYPAGSVPVNEWRTETVNLNTGKFVAFLSGDTTTTAVIGTNPGDRFLSCPQTLNDWLSATTCGTRAVPWQSNGPALYGTDDIFANGIIWDMRMGAYDGNMVFFANNLQAAAQTPNRTLSWTYRV